jgi:Ca2+/Na+ antiporter
VDKIDYISRPGQIIRIVAGIAGVVAGAELLVNSAVSIMHAFSISEKFIGLTVVAFGTSLPELATSLVAAIKKEMDISIGNLVGSNVFNILGVLGAASLIRPIQIPGGFIGFAVADDEKNFFYQQKGWHYSLVLLCGIPDIFIGEAVDAGRGEKMNVEHRTSNIEL